MAAMGHNSNGKGTEALAEIIDRVESLEAERAATAKTIKSVLATAESDGYDKKAIQQIVRERRVDMTKQAEIKVAVARYKKELGALVDTPLGEWASACLATERTVTKRGTPKALQDKSTD